MSVHGVICVILGTQNQCRRTSSFARQCSGNSRCSGSPESAGIEVVPWIVVLLWKVFVKPVVSASTPVPAAEKGLPVALVSSRERAAFKSSKELFTSSKLLVHYDPQLDLMLACDTSAYGVRAVLAHHLPDGTERPIGYASHSLSPSEQNYSQLEKERLGLSCVSGVKRFHSYLFCRSFELVTDHKPLLALLSEHRGTSHKHLPTSVDGHCCCPCMNTPRSSEGQKLTGMQTH